MDTQTAIEMNQLREVVRAYREDLTAVTSYLQRWEQQGFGDAETAFRAAELQTLARMHEKDLRAKRHDDENQRREMYLNGWRRYFAEVWESRRAKLQAASMP